jgi:tetratricopeptide (TPR) repeat protein
VSLVRQLIAAAVFAAGAYAFYVFCMRPYRCSQIKHARLGLTESAYNDGGTPEASLQAQRNLTALLPCMQIGCRDVSLYMMAAANYRVIGRYDEAIRLYREALRLDRRPELYVNLGAAEAAAGDRVTARNHMLRAALFTPWAVQGIEDGELRQDVVRQLLVLRPENSEFIHYADTIQLP